jgi:hypothetical protein
MKVDMFKDILPAINKGDRNFYNKLPPEMKKSSQVNFWMIHRWATCTHRNKEHYLMFINELCNDHYSDISNHPELQWLLLSVIGIGPEKYFGQWVGTPNSRTKENAIDKFLLDVYPTMNTKDDLQDLACKLGYNDKQISDIFDDKRRSKKK